MAAPATPAGGGEPPTLSNTSHPPLRPSFAAVTKGRPEPFHTAVQLAPRQYGTKDGKPMVHFTQSELQPGIQKLQHSLIAKFSAGRPRIDDVRRQLAQAWDLDSSVTMGAMDARHVLIILPNAPMANRILARPTRKIGNYLFRLFRWAQDFKRNKEPTTTTSWIKLPGLPSELFDAGYLEAIVKPIGRFLAIDEGTRTCRNPSFARACVELDLQNPVPNEIWIVLGASGGFWQAIEFENKLQYCKSCKLHGHLITNCRKRGGSANDSGACGPSKESNHDLTLGGCQLDMPAEAVPMEKKWSPVESCRNGKEKVEFPMAEARAIGYPSMSTTQSTDKGPAVQEDQGWTTVQRKKKKKKKQVSKKQIQMDTAMQSLSHDMDRDFSCTTNHAPNVAQIEETTIKGKESNYPNERKLSKDGQDGVHPITLQLPFASCSSSGNDVVPLASSPLPNARSSSSTMDSLDPEDNGPKSSNSKDRSKDSNALCNTLSKSALPYVPKAYTASMPLAFDKTNALPHSTLLRKIEEDHKNDCVRKILNMPNLPNSQELDLIKANLIKANYNSSIPDLIQSMEDRFRLKTPMHRRDSISDEDEDHYRRRSNPYID